jgi:hypothetical protein
MAAREPRRVKVSPTSELATALRAATTNGAPILVDTGEITYPIRVLTDVRVAADKSSIWDTYDPEKVKEALAIYGGSLSSEEADAMIGSVHAARDEGSRPVSRP